VTKPGTAALERARLSHVAQNYLSAETFSAANAPLIDAQAQIDFARQLGGGLVAAIDGMRFVVPVPSIYTGPNRKYFGSKRGLTWLNMINDQGVRWASGEGQDDWPVVGDSHRVLDVDRAAAVTAAQGPAVLGHRVVVPASGHEARLDGYDQAGAEPQPVSRAAFVGHERVLVHGPPDAVAGEVVLDAVTGHAADAGHGLADVAQSRARHGLLDPGGQHALGRRDQVAIALASPADAEADSRVSMPAVDVGAAVDAQQVAVTQPVAGGQAVQQA
jgi:hypothetical protein